MYALAVASYTNLYLGDCAAEIVYLDELAMLAEEKAAMLWRVHEKCARGSFLTMTGTDAVEILTTGITAQRSTGATTWTLLCLPWLAHAYAQLGKSDEAWQSISEALALIEESNQRGIEAEVHRVAGEIALKSPQPDIAKAEADFGRALAVARQQQAKSWELRAAMSLARLWRDQGKVQQARELLAPVYGWFTEGFDTRDLKEAKALLEELA
jgi:tetratricopeptide (TPR) repeat protein